MCLCMFGNTFEHLFGAVWYREVQRACAKSREGQGFVVILLSIM